MQVTHLQGVRHKECEQADGHLERGVAIEHQGGHRDEQLAAEDDEDPVEAVRLEVVVQPARATGVRMDK